MARTIKTADGATLDVTRRNAYMIPVERLVVKPELNTRWRAVSPTHVLSLALSILRVGQLQPVVVKLVPTRAGQPWVVAGFNRVAAIDLINRDKMGKGPWPMEVECKVQDLNDYDGMVVSIQENAARASATPMDIAYNCLRLARDYSKTNAQIAVIYNRPMTTPEERSSGEHWVERYKRLTQFPHAVQVLIDERKLSMQAARPLYDVPEDRMAEALAHILGNGHGHGQPQAVAQDDTQASEGVPTTTATTAAVTTLAPSAAAPASATVVRETVRKMGVLKTARGRNIAEYKDCLKGLGGTLTPPISAHLRWDILGSRDRLRILCSADLQWLAGTLSSEEYVRVREKATAANGGTGGGA